MVLTPAFSSTYKIPKWKCSHNMKEPNLHELDKRVKYSNILTPIMQYQSMKEGFNGFEFEICLWTHSTERVEMEHIFNTNWVFWSESCPILCIWTEKMWKGVIEGRVWFKVDKLVWEQTRGRESRHVNTSMLGKYVWELVHDTDKLWVKLLSSKLLSISYL